MSLNPSPDSQTSRNSVRALWLRKNSDTVWHCSNPNWLVFERPRSRESSLSRKSTTTSCRNSVISITMPASATAIEEYSIFGGCAGNITLRREIRCLRSSVVHAMAGLLDAERAQFWHEQFLPLAAQEHALREKLVTLGQGKPPTSSVQ